MTTAQSPARNRDPPRGDPGGRAELFAERGFHGVGVDEIGGAVGISGPGALPALRGKDAMLAEMLLDISGRLHDGGRKRVAEAADAERLLDALLSGHIDFALDDRALITLHDRELGQRARAARKLVRQLQRQYVELWVAVLRELYPGGPEAGCAPRCTPCSGCSTPRRTARASCRPRRWPSCCAAWPARRWTPPQG